MRIFRTLGIVLVVLGILVPAYGAELYTPFLPNLGFFECTAVNISRYRRNVEIEVIFSDGTQPGVIGGPLNPGGVWIINWILPGNFARGVARVNGQPEDVRAICISRESPDSPSGLTAVAEPYRISTTPRGVNTP